MSYPIDMNDLQYDLRQWTEKQFPTRSMRSILAHLREEIQELEDQPKDIKEFADCFMLLLDAASFQEIYISDIWRAAGEKLIENKDRTWGEPNEEGFCEHIEGPTGDNNEQL